MFWNRGEGWSSQCVSNSISTWVSAMFPKMPISSFRGFRSALPGDESEGLRVPAIKFREGLHGIVSVSKEVMTVLEYRKEISRKENRRSGPTNFLFLPDICEGRGVPANSNRSRFQRGRCKLTSTPVNSCHRLPYPLFSSVINMQITLTAFLRKNAALSKEFYMQTN